MVCRLMYPNRAYALCLLIVWYFLLFTLYALARFHPRCFDDVHLCSTQETVLDGFLKQKVQCCLISKPSPYNVRLRSEAKSTRLRDFVTMSHTKARLDRVWETRLPDMLV